MKIGDKVRVCRVDKAWNAYVPDLSHFIGKVGEVVEFLDDAATLYFENEMQFAFRIDWLEPVIDSTQEKALEYEVLQGSDESLRIVRITQQKYRGNQFNFGESFFRSSKKDINLLSVEKPGIAHKTIFVRGSNQEKDNALLIFHGLDQFNDFVEIVDEYNQHVATFEKNKTSIKVGDQVKVVKISKNRQSYMGELDKYRYSVGTVSGINSNEGEALLIFANGCSWWFLLSDIELHQDKKAVDALKGAKENMAKWFVRISARFTELEAASTIEDFMRAKKSVMLEAVKLPLHYVTCVHCLINMNEGESELNCDGCSYGKTHGVCDDGDSTWQNIRDRKNALLDALLKY